MTTNSYDEAKQGATEQRDVTQGVVAAIRNIAQLFRATAGDKKATEDLADTIESEQNEWAAAVTLNTGAHTSTTASTTAVLEAQATENEKAVAEHKAEVAADEEKASKKATTKK